MNRQECLDKGLLKPGNRVATDTEYERICALIRELQTTNFFGYLEMKFQAGECVLISKTEQLKIHNLRDKHDHDESNRQ